MADQEKIKSNSTNGFAHLTHDVIALCELQGRLFVLDAQASMARTRNAVVVALGGVILVLGAVFVGLAALGELLVEELAWSRSAGYAAAAVAALIVGGIVLRIAQQHFQKAAGTLNRSYEELTKNLTWIKTRLQNTTSGVRLEDSPFTRTTEGNRNGHSRRFTT